MLSETTAGVASGVWVRQALYTRSPAGRMAGVMCGVATLGVAGLLWLTLPPGLGLGILGVMPALVLGWYGGVWAGRSGAVATGAMQAGVALLRGTAESNLIVVGALVMAAVTWLAGTAAARLRFAAQSYREHAQTDPLTNLGNRRFFRDVAAVELNRSKRYRRPLSLVYIEGDGLERLRQVAGHAAADAVLVQMASVMTGTLRTSDVVARLTDAEFAILLPETSGEGARVVADKLRERLAEATAGEGPLLTFRAAVVGFADGAVSLDAMLRQADEAMLQSRRGGGELTEYRDYVHPPVQLV
jgi:diguanylate cyclase (GGDEF)-like protein